MALSRVEPSGASANLRAVKNGAENCSSLSLHPAAAEESTRKNLPSECGVRCGSNKLNQHAIWIAFNWVNRQQSFFIYEASWARWRWMEFMIAEFCNSIKSRKHLHRSHRQWVLRWMHNGVHFPFFFFFFFVCDFDAMHGIQTIRRFALKWDFHKVFAVVVNLLLVD